METYGNKLDPHRFTRTAFGVKGNRQSIAIPNTPNTNPDRPVSRPRRRRRHRPSNGASRYQSRLGAAKTSAIRWSDRGALYTCVAPHGVEHQPEHARKKTQGNPIALRGPGGWRYGAGVRP